MQLQALREPNFRRLFLGQAASSFGDALVPVALTFAVLREFRSATDLGFVLGAETIAAILLFLLGGVAGDRLSRRLVMIASDAVRCVCEVAIGVLFIAGRPPLIGLCALAALYGVAGGMFTPAAGGLVPEVVSQEHLHQANTLMAMASNLTAVIGPATAGLLVVTVGGGWAIVADGATFALNIAVLAGLKVALPMRVGGESVLRQLREGWYVFKSLRWFVDIALSGTAFNYFTGIYYTLAPVIANRFFGGAGAWAAVAVAGAIGGIAGGVLVMRLTLRHPLRTGMLMMLAWPLLPLTFALRLPLPAICIVAALAFVGIISFDSLYFTTIQQAVPESVRSRVMSYDYFFAAMAFPAGLMTAGPLAGLLGARTVLAAAGVSSLIIIAATAAAPSVRHFQREPLTTGAEPSD